ncbi:unnamed protein product, partial [marine sediment metagenome]
GKNEFLGMLLREIEVENKIREYLQQNGFSVEPRTRRQGPDILAKKDGKYCCVEVEGNMKPKEERSLAPSQKYTHYFRAIGQLALRISEYPNSTYILGLPKDEYYQDKVSKTKVALEKLVIKVYFVTERGIEIL